ncbi:unnamed protein product [Prorocentrum cordatum]|uniref:Phospholipase B-like n=1 Tax=Prorocentrum cordatum TaxID=2364126 RepID=A0ABN9XBP4_9DINO|nr:unnamed protein product [Polarella glacialis]
MGGLLSQSGATKASYLQLRALVEPRSSGSSGYSKLGGAEAGRTPEAVIVQSPNGQPKCAGRYVLTDDVANGKPVWRTSKQAGSGELEDRWIYFSIKSTWNIGGKKARQTDFSTHSAFVFGEASLGRLDSPHQVTKSWWIATEGRTFQRDPCIIVKAEVRPPEEPAPCPVFLQCGQPRSAAAAAALVGLALVLAGSLAAGRPLLRAPGGGDHRAGLSLSQCEAALNDPSSALSIFLECKGVQLELTTAGRTTSAREGYGPEPLVGGPERL